MPEREDVIVHASMTKQAIYDTLKEQEYDEEVTIPKSNVKKAELLEFALEAFGPDRVVTEENEDTRKWAAEDGNGPKFGNGAGGGGAKSTREPTRDPMDWTREELEAEAAKYPNRSVWNRRGKASHAAARAQGILEILMPAKLTRVPLTEEINEENVIKRMQEFDNRTDFSHAYRRHYNFAKETGLLDEYLPSLIGTKKADDSKGEEDQVDGDQTDEDQIDGDEVDIEDEDEDGVVAAE